MMSAVRLVVVTGAGASRDLGVEGTQLPLMSDWSDYLCGALDDAEPGLAKAAHLEPGMSGPEFEEALGLLLRWRDMLPLAERFELLGGPHPGSTTEPVITARTKTVARMTTIVEVVNTTLYDLFGMRRIDEDRARMAYSHVLSQWFTRPDTLVVGTTNYDLSAEAALQASGYEVASGFDQRPGRAPVLQPEGIVDWEHDHAGKVPVLHLHGAVGWYEQGGAVLDRYADQPFNATLGTPAVLYPDPTKDPTHDAAVQALWREFEHAIGGATHVLVIGHSLHDDPLVRMLAPKRHHVAVLIHAGGGIGADVIDSETARIAALLPDATLLRGAFGSGPVLHSSTEFEDWVKRWTNPE